MNKFKALLRGMLARKSSDVSTDSAEVIRELVSVRLDESGALSHQINKSDKYRISNLKIAGDLNSTDVGFLRSMSRLEVLDLSDARIVVGGNYYIKSLYCQNENDAMGLYMFHRNACLRSITFPKSVRFVRAFAFRRCTALSEVHFSDVLELIGERAFSYCESLLSIQFPSSLKTIRDMAFTHCKQLRNLKLPDSVTDIGNYAFGDCPALESVRLSASLQNLGAEVFKGCLRLSSVHAAGLTPALAKTNAFDGVDVERCTLFVAKGCREKYATAGGWKVFKHIVEE